MENPFGKAPSEKTISKKAFKVVPFSQTIAVNDPAAATNPNHAPDPQYTARQLETESSSGRFVELKRFDDSSEIPTFAGIITRKGFGDKPQVFTVSHEDKLGRLAPANEAQRSEVMRMLDLLGKRGFIVSHEAITQVPSDEVAVEQSTQVREISTP